MNGSRKMKLGNLRKAILYTRVSTGQQELSPEAQLRDMKRFCKANEIEICDVFHEVVSGSVDVSGRKVLIDAIGALQEHNAGKFIVARADRLSRKVLNSALIRQMVKDQGAWVVDVTRPAADKPDLDPAEEFMQTVFDAMAQWERAMIALRTRNAMLVKKAAGMRVGAIPYGFVLDDSGVYLVPHRRETQVIADILEMDGAGVEIKEIVRTLLGRRIYSRSGKPFEANQIVRIIKGHKDISEKKIADAGVADD